MNYHIAVIPGDGIGPEIVAEAKKVLNKVADTYGHTFEYEELLMGGCSIDAYGEPLTDETLERARKSDSILLGAVGGRVGVDSWYELPPEKRPEAGLLKIRKGLGLFCNLRPAILFEELSGACPLKEEIVEGGFDFIFARELTGGLYFGERYTKEIDGVRTAVDTLKYDENEIRRIAIQAFEIAMKRNKKVCSVDKANVLDSSRLWSKVVEEVSKDYPEVTLASMVTGSLGMLSSASLGEGTFGMYEPSHGSAPDIAGQNKANPIATILSAAMLLRYSFGLSKEADAVENAVKTVLKKGMRTIDIMDEGKTLLGTKEMGDAIAAEIE